MKLSTQGYKGTRDFYPEDKRLQKYMFDVMRRVVERFGYQECDAPSIEPVELYMGKTSQEIVSEQTFVFIDRGGRTVTLRPEMTPSVSRMVAARRQELAYPLRWYSLPALWRYERPQAGRLREHWQLNVDLFGIAGLEAEHEAILIADLIMKEFGATPQMYEIRLNSRQLVNHILHERLQLDQFQALALVRLMDKLGKISDKEFTTAAETVLGSGQKSQDTVESLLDILKAKNLSELPLELQQHPAARELAQLMEMLTASGVSSTVFTPGLIRGFDYYTNIVFEVFDLHPGNNRSMFGGGRYDSLVSAFGVEPVPTVGFGMGDVTLQEFLKAHKLLPRLKPETDAVVVLVGDVYGQAQRTLATLRGEGLRLAVDATGRRTGDQLKSAAKAGILHAIIIGEHEIVSGRLKLKDLASGEEQDLAPERVISKLAGRHKPEQELID